MAHLLSGDSMCGQFDSAVAALTDVSLNDVVSNKGKRLRLIMQIT